MTTEFDTTATPAAGFTVSAIAATRDCYDMLARIEEAARVALADMDENPF